MSVFDETLSEMSVVDVRMTVTLRHQADCASYVEHSLIVLSPTSMSVLRVFVLVDVPMAVGVPGCECADVPLRNYSLTPGCEVIRVRLVSTLVSPCRYFNLSQYSISVKFWGCVCM